MTTLILAAVLWVVWHIVLSGTEMRDIAVARLGANAFRIVFSLGSVLSIVLLVLSYNASSTTLLWIIPAWLQWLLIAAMLCACILFVGSLSAPNPTAVGQELKPAAGDPVRGVGRITRHPMLVAFGVWSVVHMIANGDTASFLFFGAFLVTVLAGIPSLDRKLARRDPARFAPIARASSMLPFAAIAQGRNRMVLRELAIPLIGGVVLWAILLGGHSHIIGISPFPA